LSQQSRASGIIVLVILEVLLGALLLFGGVERHEHANGTWWAGSFMIILAALSFCFAFGIWAGKTWAWMGSIGLAVLGIIFSIFLLFVRPTVGGGIYLIASTVLIYFLIQPRVQRHFGRNIA